jgi:hypothetical protein
MYRLGNTGTDSHNLIAMFWTSAYSRQCRIDTVHTFSSINTEASLDKIWKTVVDVWNATSSAEVARAFVLAYRVMRLVIEENGNIHGYPMAPLTAKCENTSKIPLLA